MATDLHLRVRDVSTGSFRGKVVVDSTTDHFLRNDGNPDDLLVDNSDFLKSSESTCSALVQIPAASTAGDLEPLFVKKFLFKGIVHSLKPLFRPHRAQIMWRVSWHLLNHSIPVAEPEGYLTKQRGPFCLRGYFFAKVLPRCSTLDELADDLGQLIKRFDSGGLSGVLAQNIASMHTSGVSHGDLKWSNILVHENKNELWFVDLDSAQLYGRAPSTKAVARDLARFLLSGQETGIEEAILERFLNEYAHHRKLSRARIDGPIAKILTKLQDRHKKKYGDKRSKSGSGTNS
jgi:RIO kinase 1